MKESIQRAVLYAGSNRTLRWVWDIFFFGVTTLNSFLFLSLRTKLTFIRTAAIVLAVQYALIFFAETLMLLLAGDKYSRRLYRNTRRIFKLLYMVMYLIVLGYRQASLGLLDHPTRQALRVGAWDLCMAAIIVVSSTSGFWIDKVIARIRERMTLRTG